MSRAIMIERVPHITTSQRHLLISLAVNRICHRHRWITLATAQQPIDRLTISNRIMNQDPHPVTIQATVRRQIYSVRRMRTQRSINIVRRPFTNRVIRMSIDHHHPATQTIALHTITIDTKSPRSSVRHLLHSNWIDMMQLNRSIGQATQRSPFTAKGIQTMTIDLIEDHRLAEIMGHHLTRLAIGQRSPNANHSRRTAATWIANVKFARHRIITGNQRIRHSFRTR